jgi:hypothetical protein
MSTEDGRLVVDPAGQVRCTPFEQAPRPRSRED